MQTKLPFFVAIALLSGPAIATQQGSMSIAAFLKRAEPLRSNPILAMASNDFQILKSELDGAEAQVRAVNAARIAKKQRPLSCPPQEARMNIDELLTHFKTYTANAARRTSVSTGLSTFMARKFPC